MISHPLYPFQATAVSAVREAWATSRRVLLVSPTGSGKTRMGVACVLEAVAEGRQVLWMAPRRELVTQALERLRAEGLGEIGILAAGIEDPAPNARVRVASLQTLLRRDVAPESGLVVCDEAHHYVSEEWGAYVRRHGDARVLGLTATPERGDGRPLGDLFERLVVAAQSSELIARGVLVPCDVLAPKKGLGHKIARAPVEAWKEHANRRPTIVFCKNRTHALAVTREFQRERARVAFVSAMTPRAERARVLAAFKAGAIDVLVNVFLLVEGWDAPIAEVCLLARRCETIGTYTQIVGRILRPSPGKDRAMVIDLAGAVHRNGHPDADREYSLEGSRGILWPPKGPGPGQDDSCYERDPFPKITGDELVRIERARFMELVREAIERNMPAGWAAEQYRAKARYPISHDGIV
jgi:DNA repair protein RadD